MDISPIDLDLPDYQHILKYVLRRQIQTLVNQLFEETGDETVVLSASMASGTITQLGSDAAKSFIGEHTNITTNFLAFVQKKHSKSPSQKSEQPPDKETALKGNRSAKGKKLSQSKRRSAISPSFEKPAKLFKPQQSDAKIHISSQPGNDSQECTGSETRLESKSPSTKSEQYKTKSVPETLEMNAYTEAEQSALLNRVEMKVKSDIAGEQNDKRENAEMTSEYVNAERLPEIKDYRGNSSAIPQNVDAKNSSITNATMEHEEDYANFIIKTEPEEDDGGEEIGVFNEFLQGLPDVDSADNVVDHLSTPCGSGLAAHTNSYLSTPGVSVDHLPILGGSGITTGLKEDLSTAVYGTSAVEKQAVEDYFTKAKDNDAKGALMKADTHFLVKYLCDDKMQIRSRNHVKTTDQICLSSVHEFQWGNYSRVDRAIVLGAGSDTEMRDLLQKSTSRTKLKQHKPATRHQTPKTLKTTKKKATVVKKIIPPRFYSSSSSDEADTDIVAATAEPGPDTVATTAEPVPDTVAPTTAPSLDTVAPTAEHVPDTVTPTAEPIPHIVVPKAEPGLDTVVPTSEPGPDTLAPTGEPSWNQQPPISSTSTSFLQPLTPFTNNDIVIAIQALAQQVSIMNITCDKLGKLTEANKGVLGDIQNKLDRMETCMDAMTVQVQMHTDTPAQTPPHTTEETTSDLDGIPPQFAIGDDELHLLQRDSKNVGHFACNMTARVFPELFDRENLRFNYNWHGNGQLMKLELNPSKKDVVRKYVNYYYPETKSQASWNGIVIRINERLRRKDKVKNTGLAMQEGPADNVSVLSDMTQGSS